LCAGPKEDLLTAAANLEKKANYTWTTELQGRHPIVGPHKGAVDSTGLTSFHMRFEDADIDGVGRGESRFVKAASEWKSAALVTAKRPMPGTPVEPSYRAAALLTQLKTPTQETKSVLEKMDAIEAKADGSFEGALNADLIPGILLSVGISPADARLENAKGSATFWVKEGLLQRYALKYSGLIKGPFGELDLSRTNITEISAVGTTRVELPPEVQKLLDAAKK
jgi:hypothetical protein